MSDGRRHAALMLHSLAEDDRRWVLQQLPGGDRAPLETLLGELLELGIPADPSIVQAMPLDAAGRIRAASARTIRALLQREPDAIVGACLAMDAWPWRDEVLRKLPSERRAPVAAAMQRPVTAKMRDTLIALLDARLVPGSARPRAHAFAKRAIERTRRLWRR